MDLYGLHTTKRPMNVLYLSTIPIGSCRSCVVVWLGMAGIVFFIAQSHFVHSQTTQSHVLLRHLTINLLLLLEYITRHEAVIYFYFYTPLTDTLRGLFFQLKHCHGEDRICSLYSIYCFMILKLYCNPHYIAYIKWFTVHSYFIIIITFTISFSCLNVRHTKCKREGHIILHATNCVTYWIWFIVCIYTLHVLYISHRPLI